MVKNNFEDYQILKKQEYASHSKMDNAQRLRINVNMRMVRRKLRNLPMTIFLREMKGEIVEITETKSTEIIDIIVIIGIIGIIETIEIIEIIGIIEMIEIIETGMIDMIDLIETIETTEMIVMIVMKGRDMRIIDIEKGIIVRTTDTKIAIILEIIKIKILPQTSQCHTVLIWAILVSNI